MYYFSTLAIITLKKRYTMRKILFTAAILALTSSTIFAQGGVHDRSSGGIASMTKKSFFSIEKDNNIKGTPYLFDTWKKGSIILTTKK